LNQLTFDLDFACICVTPEADRGLKFKVISQGQRSMLICVCYCGVQWVLADGETGGVSRQPAGAGHSSQSQAPLINGPRPAAAAESSVCGRGIDVGLTSILN